MMTHGDTDVFSKLGFTKDLNLSPMIDQFELIFLAIILGPSFTLLLSAIMKRVVF